MLGSQATVSMWCRARLTTAPLASAVPTVVWTACVIALTLAASEAEAAKITVGDPDGVSIARDGGTRYLLVSSFQCHVQGCEYENAVLRYDGTTGAFLGVQVADINGPTGIALHPHKETLLVASRGDDAVYEYDIRTGQSLGAFVTAGPEGLNAPQALTLTPGDSLLVTSTQTEGNLDKFNGILEFDGSTGEFIAPFVDGGYVLYDTCDDPRCLRGPNAMAYGPNEHLYVTSGVNHLIIEYDGASGVYLDSFDSSKLVSPVGVIARPSGTPREGNILATSKYPDPRNPLDDVIVEFDKVTYELITTGGGVLVSALINPGPLCWQDNGNLLVAERRGELPPTFSDRIIERERDTGTFVDVLTPDGDTNIHFATAMLMVATGYASGDHDEDGDVDLKDFSAFQRCFGAVSSEDCLASFDDGLTGSVFDYDLNVFVRNFTGPQRPCQNDVECDDNKACTIDTCVDGVCAYSFAPNGTSCADELFCNGEETCLEGFCIGLPPCIDVAHCDEDTDACLECLTNAECDDIDPCTDDFCDLTASCGHSFNSAPCDDGNVCTIDDACSAGNCESGSSLTCDDGNICTDDSCDPKLGCLFINNLAPCDDDNICTVNDRCLLGECKAGMDLDCDDGNPCTDDSCDPLLSCQYLNNANPCDDGDACTTDDTCTGGTCVGRPIDCEDGVFCTQDSCVDGVCRNTPDDSLCVNGMFCDGAEKCDPVSDCQSGSDPCPGQMCDEVNNACVECLGDGDCDDGQYCTGVETCVSGVCQPGNDPCPGQMCDEVNDACIECLGDGDCDDGQYCTGIETCVSGVCQPGNDPCPGQMCDEVNDACIECLVDGDCDDGQYCTGIETCMGGACQPGSDPCPGQMCDEVNDACVDCLTDGDCDDGQYCTGVETCVGGVCQPGSDPCPGQMCDEVNDACVECLVDGDCDDGQFCTGVETCVGGACQPGNDPCPGQTCVELHDACVP